MSLAAASTKKACGPVSLRSNDCPLFRQAHRAPRIGRPDCRLADAESYARKALKADDTFRDARNLLGQILILEKKYDEAIAMLEPLTKDPAYTANYLAWGNLGWAQVLGGQVDAGIASLR